MIETLFLENFRNYETANLSFTPGVNLIVGENAQGKTNLLEASAALSTLKLFRTTQKKEGIRFGTDSARICGTFHTEGHRITLDLRLHQNRTMEILKNDMRVRRQSDVRGILRTVLFCPEDLMLIRAGAHARRRFLDTAISQLRPHYAGVLAEYEKVTMHKLRILKDNQEKPALMQLLDDFTLRQCKLGSRIIRYRASYIQKLAMLARQLHTEAAPDETLDCAYQTVSSVTNPMASASIIETELQEYAFSHRNAEIAAHTCLVGVHKDDLVIYLNGVSASSYASQGQTRTAALALKLAERAVFFDADHAYPVLLLDDVLSELDHKRQDFVLNHLGDGQVLITCCEPQTIQRFQTGSVFHIENGKIHQP